MVMPMPDGELPFSHEYAKHDRAVFPTIRRRDKFGDVGETVEVTADDEKLGDAEIVAKETVRFGDLPTWLLCYDCEISPDGENSNRDKDLRAAGLWTGMSRIASTQDFMRKYTLSEMRDSNQTVLWSLLKTGEK